MVTEFRRRRDVSGPRLERDSRNPLFAAGGSVLRVSQSSPDGHVIESPGRSSALNEAGVAWSVWDPRLASTATATCGSAMRIRCANILEAIERILA